MSGALTATGDGASDWNQSLGTYLTPSTTLGIRVAASSTIGGGTGATGLTISGGATTTGNAYFGGLIGVGSTTPNALLTITNKLTGTQDTPLFTIASTTAGTATTTLFQVNAGGSIAMGGATSTIGFGLLVSGQRNTLTSTGTLNYSSTIFGSDNVLASTSDLYSSALYGESNSFIDNSQLYMSSSFGEQSTFNNGFLSMSAHYGFRSIIRNNGTMTYGSLFGDDNILDGGDIRESALYGYNNKIIGLFAALTNSSLFGDSNSISDFATFNFSSLYGESNIASSSAAFNYSSLYGKSNVATSSAQFNYSSLYGQQNRASSTANISSSALYGSYNAYLGNLATSSVFGDRNIIGSGQKSALFLFGSANTATNTVSNAFVLGSNNTLDNLSNVFAVGSGIGTLRSNFATFGNLLNIDTASGSVSVGTTTPSAKFSIQGGYGSTSALFDIATTTSAAFATSSLFRVNHDGKVGIGTTTPEGLFTMQYTNATGSVIAGMKQYFSFANSTQSAVYYGDNSYIVNAPNATSTLVGKIIRIEDSTQLGNTVRGLEVQAHRGTNTKGENTALSGFGRTFGVRGATEGDAGDTFVPAGVFADLRGTTQGNALRAYSGTITTSNLVHLFHDSSVFSGTGLLMNFGNSGGSFAATSSAKFIDLQVGGTSKFTVTAGGTTTIGDGTTGYMAGLQIGFGGLCVDNDGSCTATTAGRISAVQYGTANSDLAEMYFSSDDLRTGEIVMLEGGLSIGRAVRGGVSPILGVVSTKPGLVMGSDDSSLRSGEAGYPIGLKGRVPIRLSTETGPIVKGDRIALSSIPGVGMKATESDVVVGIALEDFDGDRAYSEGFVNQFSDDLVKAKMKPRNQNTDTRTQDGCSFGGGGAQGEEKCVKEQVSEIAIETITVDEKTQIIIELRAEESERMTLGEGEEVRVGQVIMFIDLGYHFAQSDTDLLKELLSTSTLQNGNGEETLWSRLKTLAQNFVDGVLTVTGIKTDELCVGSVCVDEATFLKMVEQAGRPASASHDVQDVPETDEATGDIEKDVQNNTDTNSSHPESSPPSEDDAGAGNEPIEEVPAPNDEESEGELEEETFTPQEEQSDEPPIEQSEDQGEENISTNEPTL